MRLTKNLITRAKGRLKMRQSEIISIMELGGIQKEMKRVWPVYVEGTDTDISCVRTLLGFALEEAIPDNWLW
jgi:hypothetical protein